MDYRRIVLSATDSSNEPVYLELRHRASAAFLAICFRFRGERLSALAFPPFIPPILPSATACGFFLAFGSSSGDPSSFSPIACSTTRLATVMKSCSLVFLLERLGMIELLQIRGKAGNEMLTKSLVIAAISSLLTIGSSPQRDSVFAPLPDGSARAAYLLNQCEGAQATAADTIRQAGYQLGCYGYIQGVRDTLVQFPNTDPALRFCVPATVTFEQQVLIFIKFSKGRPEHLHEPAVLEFLRSLHGAFPCK